MIACSQQCMSARKLMYIRVHYVTGMKTCVHYDNKKVSCACVHYDTKSCLSACCHTKCITVAWLCQEYSVNRSVCAYDYIQLAQQIRDIT